MAEIIDLDLLVSEDIVYKISGNKYAVPTDMNTSTIIKLSQIEQKINKAQKSKDIEQALMLQDELVYILLSQQNDVTKEWVEKLHNSQKIAILKNYRNRLEELNQDPNSNSLPSQK